MTNFSAKILNNAISALNAQQAVIAVTGNNIGNVNTPGYSRRVVELEARSAGLTQQVNIGNGVDATGIRRIADQYLNRLYAESINDKSKSEVESEFLARVEALFSMNADDTSIGSALTAFYTAADDLATDPASLELRTEFIERGTDLVNTITSTYDSLANLQREADDRLATELETVNSITAEIAELNGIINGREAGGGTAADERDRRDLLLQQLSEKVGYDQTELEDGTVMITLADGLALVSGTTSRDLELTVAPSFAGGTLPPGLDGGVLNYVVYDFSDGAGTGHVDYTQNLQQGGGTIGGLLTIRGHADTSNTSAFEADGILVDLASRIESLTQTLLTSVNTEYLGPDRDTSTPLVHDPSSGDLDGNNPNVYGLFTFSYTGTRDDDGNGLPDDLAALGIDNFSSILQLGISDPREVAAARDTGAGAPAAAVYNSGDAQNISAIAGLQDTSYTFSVGSYSQTQTMQELYGGMVTRVGTAKMRADTSLEVAQDNYVAAGNARDAVSAVSLDEEFTNLIKFQKAFEASARMVRVAQELLDQLVNIL